MSRYLDIKGVQSDTVWHRPDLNRKELSEEFASWNDDFDVLILPEMFSTGFTMEPQNIPAEEDQKTVAWMRQWAERFDALLLGSIIFREEDSVYNRLLAVRAEGSISTYDKHHLFSYAGEEQKYDRGSERLIITHNGWKICPLICYDLRFPEWSRNDEDYDLLIYVANWPDTRASAWKALLRARAVENQSWVAGINRVGTDENDLSYQGDSAVFNFAGEPITGLRHQRGNIRATLDRDAQDAFRDRFPFLEDQDSFTIDIK